MNYTQATAKLTGRCKDSRKVANNTYLQRRGPNAIALRLHATDIIVFHEDNSCTVNVGTWLTVTTKARLNEYLPFGRVYSERGTWYVSTGGWSDPNAKRYVFANGMTFHADGTVTGAGDVTAEAEARKLRKRIGQ